jgi:hypothetical protein
MGVEYILGTMISFSSYPSTEKVLLFPTFSNEEAASHQQSCAPFLFL